MSKQHVFGDVVDGVLFILLHTKNALRTGACCNLFPKTFKRISLLLDKSCMSPKDAEYVG